MALRTIAICNRCKRERPILPSFGLCVYCREAERKGRKVRPRAVIGICSRCDRERLLIDGKCPRCRDLETRGHLPQRSPEWRQRIADSQRGEKNHAYRGGRIIDKHGYVWVLAAGDPIAEAMLTSSSKGYVQEHRLAVARLLGRPLRRGETVHHINGERDDNRLENLQLRQGQHGPGQVWRCQCCGSYDVAAEPLPDLSAAHSAAV